MTRAIPLLICCCATALSCNEDIPIEIQRLNELRARQIEKIDKVYIEQLEALKIKYTKAGDLDAANQVVAIVKHLSPTDSEAKESKWAWGSGGELTLKPSGIATHTAWNKNGKWRKEKDGSIRLESGYNGDLFIVRIEGDLGQVIKIADGTKTTIKRKAAGK